MADFEARHIIEALRSGIPSRVVGACFTEARADMNAKITQVYDKVLETKVSSGFIFKGQYGEGKTHLMNTLFNQATKDNVVVSFLPLGKETPPDKLFLLYQKLMANTYLPGARQPGFGQIFEEMTYGGTLATELLDYTWNELETDKLHYLLSAYLQTQEADERRAFLADLEGDFVSNTLIRQAFRRVTKQRGVKFNTAFKKGQHTMDYFHFMSHLFQQKGYAGWCILLDEAELIGKFGKAARLKGYRELDRFLKPDSGLEATFTLLSFTGTFAEEYIYKKKDLENVETYFAEDPSSKEMALDTIQTILKAPELAHMTKEEFMGILDKILSYHAAAYDWKPDFTLEDLYAVIERRGLLLRTKIRAVIETLDQAYQYGSAGETTIHAVDSDTFTEEEEEEEDEDSPLKKATKGLEDIDFTSFHVVDVDEKRRPQWDDEASNPFWSGDEES